MRTTVQSLGLALIAAGALSAGTIAGTISLTGTDDLVAFNGALDTITLGEGCPTVDKVSNCTFGGSQALGAGTLSWAFETPNTPGNITFDGAGDVYGPTGGTFSATDGLDILNGTYTLSSWSFDGVPDSHGYDGIDLSGSITVTGLTLEGIEDPNEAAFESLFSQPGTSAYSFVLDVGDCTGGARYTACIQPLDPSAAFNSLSLQPSIVTPEPGTLALMAAGLLAMFDARRRKNALPARRRP